MALFSEIVYGLLRFDSYTNTFFLSVLNFVGHTYGREDTRLVDIDIGIGADADASADSEDVDSQE